jgi:hypothetical protein
VKIKKLVTVVPREKQRRRRPLKKVPTIAEATGLFSTEVLCVYRGHDPDIDAKVRKLARGRDMGSGMDLIRNVRDLNFSFPSEAKAVAAAKRIKRAHLPVRVLVRGFWSV